MAALEIPVNGDTVHTVGEEVIQKVLDSVEDHLQKVKLCFNVSLSPIMFYCFTYCLKLISCSAKGNSIFFEDALF